MIWSFASGTYASLVAKIATKDLTTSDGFWHSRYLYNCFDVQDMIESFASGATAFLELKNYISHLESYRAQIWDLSYLPTSILLGPILKPIWVYLILQVCLLQLSFQLLISELVEEVQGLNLVLQLITPKSMTRTNFESKISWFCLAGSPLVAIIDFLMFISQQLEELEDQYLEFLQNSPQYFYGTFLEPCGPSWIFLKSYILAVGRPI